MYASKQRQCSVVVCILCFPSEHEHGHTELENVFQQDAIFRRSFQSNSIEHLLNTTQKKHQICRRVINFVRYLMRTPSCSTNTSTSTHSRIMSFPSLRRSPKKFGAPARTQVPRAAGAGHARGRLRARREVRRHRADLQRWAPTMRGGH